MKSVGQGCGEGVSRQVMRLKELRGFAWLVKDAQRRNDILKSWTVVSTDRGQIPDHLANLARFYTKLGLKSFERWHQKTCHVGAQKLKYALGEKCADTSGKCPCIWCAFGKTHSQPHVKRNTKESITISIDLVNVLTEISMGSI